MGSPKPPGAAVLVVVVSPNPIPVPGAMEAVGADKPPSPILGAGRVDAAVAPSFRPPPPRPPPPRPPPRLKPISTNVKL